MDEEPKTAGRPTVIGPVTQREIIAIVKAGASLNDASDICEIARSTINKKMAEDPDFRKRVDRAIASGKARLIKKIDKAKPWQAAAWLLERKFGAEFGKKEVHQHVGPDGGPIKTEHKIDYAAIENELRGLTRAGVATRTPEDN